MPIYSKESLETLKQRIDLVDVLTSHIEFKRSGAAYKAICPFHDEKTPSFMIQKGDSHYHCYGCGAHGDAIQFLMSHLKINFIEAVEALAQRFHVHLEVVEGNAGTSPNKGALKEALEFTCQFYHFYLLHTEEGHQVLSYLYNRGIDLEFIRRFQIGLAPAKLGMLRKLLHAKFVKDQTLLDAGLLTTTASGSYRDFFAERITFPIRDVAGAVIGFSARKYREETFGGKYVNTSETALFKKSKVLFGLNYCRKRIAKERQAIIVEGQIDALRLIQAGYNITVAGQGTAFGESHAKELMALGVNIVFLAMDSDEAGQKAAEKIGHFFQKEGVGVQIVKMPPGKDPDVYIRENGPESFLALLQNSSSYISFLIQRYALRLDITSPSGKTELLKEVSKQIRSWENQVMIHESLRQLAALTHTPEEMLGVGQQHVANIYIKTKASVGQMQVNPDRIMEADVLRWLLLMGHEKPQFVEKAGSCLKNEHFYDPSCRAMFEAYMRIYPENNKPDYLTMLIQTRDAEGAELLTEISNKKTNKDRADLHFNEALEKILTRHIMVKRENIRQKIQSGNCSDEEVSDLVKQFDELKYQPQSL